MLWSHSQPGDFPCHSRVVPTCCLEPLHNKLFAVFANIPIGVPYSASFQPYHQLHHKFLGDMYLDTDLPTEYEGRFCRACLASCFAIFQIFFYALRPMFITQIKFTYVHLVNVVFQLIFDHVMVTYWGWKALGYFIVSTRFWRGRCTHVLATLLLSIMC